jgi:hypothetical protein
MDDRTQRVFIEEAFSRRDYTTISCGPLVDALATVALENRTRSRRNLKIIRESVGLLGEWIDSEPLFHWLSQRLVQLPLWATT